MAKATKKNTQPAPEAPTFAPPTENPVITLAHVAQASDADPFYLMIPAEQANEWAAAGLVEVNPNITNETGAIAARITDAGRNYKTMEDTNNAGTEGTTEGAQGSEAVGFDFAVETIDAIVPKRVRAETPAKYPFDRLGAPVTGEDGKPKNQAFFVPATAERPEPWKSLASTVSTHKAKFATKTGEETYTSKGVQKTRNTYEYSRDFRITEGVKEIDGKTVKGAWIARTK